MKNAALIEENMLNVYTNKNSTRFTENISKFMVSKLGKYIFNKLLRYCVSPTACNIKYITGLCKDNKPYYLNIQKYDAFFKNVYYLFKDKTMLLSIISSVKNDYDIIYIATRRDAAVYSKIHFYSPLIEEKCEPNLAILRTRFCSCKNTPPPGQDGFPIVRIYNKLPDANNTREELVEMGGLPHACETWSKKNMLQVIYPNLSFL